MCPVLKSKIKRLSTALGVLQLSVITPVSDGDLQLYRQLKDWHNHVADILICVSDVLALTVSLSRNHEADGSQGVSSRLQRKSLTGRCLPQVDISPLFTMLVQLLLHYGVLQPIRNCQRSVKTSHFKESKAALWDLGKKGSMGHVQMSSK